MTVSYYDYLKDVKNTYLARNRILDHLKRNQGNIMRTAQEMQTTRTTVRQVKRLYQSGGLKALKDRRQGPHRQ